VADLTRLFGHTAGGRPAERLMASLGLPQSDDTILRSLKAMSAHATKQWRCGWSGMTGLGRRVFVTGRSWSTSNGARSLDSTEFATDPRRLRRNLNHAQSGRS
jgi:hypothetical protein